MNSLDEAYTDAWTPYGVLADKKAVCLGIAQTFKLLCDAVDIPCIVVLGDASGGHASNMVRIDKRYFWVDCTWNLSENFSRTFPFMRYQYFNVPDRLMAVHHKVNCPILPSCTSLHYNPFKMRELCITDQTQIVPTAVKYIAEGMERFAFLLDFPDFGKVDLNAIAWEVNQQVPQGVYVSRDKYCNYIGFVVNG